MIIKPLTCGPYNSIHFLQILCEPSHCWKSTKTQPQKKQSKNIYFWEDLFYNWGRGGGPVFMNRGVRVFSGFVARRFSSPQCVGTSAQLWRGNCDRAMTWLWNVVEHHLLHQTGDAGSRPRVIMESEQKSRAFHNHGQRPELRFSPRIPEEPGLD